GGGSNAAGLIFPFMKEKLSGRRSTRFRAVEPTSCPSLTKGEYRYDFGDVAGLTPLMKMYTLGHTFIPAGIHAGGLRYHAMAPLLCQLYEEGYIEAKAYPQTPCFEAATLFARTEASSPHPKAATPSVPQSMRHSPQRRRASPAPFSSTSAATGSWTCRPTMITSPVSSSTTTTPLKRCAKP